MHWFEQLPAAAEADKVPEPADPATKAAGAEPAAAEAGKDSEAVASENPASVQQQPAGDADNVANVQEKDEAAKDVKVTFPL
ncbi:MAG: hypothetical protein ACPIOQ_19520 [Promethearchaeia archaeon]